MPRSARIDIPGLLQHVIVRGIERRDIFLDDRDRTLFLDRLSTLLVKTETDCLAWSLMTNHFHLLLRPRKSQLSTLMRRLLTGYAVVSTSDRASFPEHPSGTLMISLTWSSYPFPSGKLGCP